MEESLKLSVLMAPLGKQSLNMILLFNSNKKKKHRNYHTKQHLEISEHFIFHMRTIWCGKVEIFALLCSLWWSEITWWFRRTIDANRICNHFLSEWQSKPLRCDWSVRNRVKSNHSKAVNDLFGTFERFDRVNIGW